jgi:hypothetical protein
MSPRAGRGDVSYFAAQGDPADYDRWRPPGRFDESSRKSLEQSRHR